MVLVKEMHFAQALIGKATDDAPHTGVSRLQCHATRVVTQPRLYATKHTGIQDLNEDDQSLTFAPSNRNVRALDWQSGPKLVPQPTQEHLGPTTHQ